MLNQVKRKCPNCGSENVKILTSEEEEFLYCNNCQKVNLIIKVKLETNKITPKPCPFCFGQSYYYRTKNGLIRHVQNYHMYDTSGIQVLPPAQDARLVRKDTPSGCEFIPVSNWNEVENFLKEYSTGLKNPSKKCSRLWRYVSK